MTVILNKQAIRNELFSIIGNRYGRLVVIKEVERKYERRHWLCRCDCGTEKIVNGNNLNRGQTRSCGCLQLELVKKMLTTHGLTTSKEYNSWCHMKGRCYNKKNKNYPHYGERGIKVCERWINSFENFIKDMGFSPSPKHTLDRFPNNDGNYKPSNCRWATQKEQVNNRRVNVLFTYNGITRNLAQWTEKLGLKNYVFGNARYRGKSIEDIIEKHFNK